MKDNPIKQEKKRKLKELRAKDVDPYPHTWKKAGWKNKSSIQYLLDQNKKNLDTEKFYCVAGRLMRKRPMGKADFFNLRDEGGELQCYIKRDDFKKIESQSSTSETNRLPYKKGGSLDDNSNLSQNSFQIKNPVKKNESGDHDLSPWELWKLCDIGDILSLRGRLFITKRGELSLRVQDLKILCKSLEALPEKYHGLEDKELKYRYRHMDLIMDQKSKEIFRTRSQVIQEIRDFMNKKGFMEVETPVLQSVYGGAAAEPFETHFRRLNKKMYLKISPEIYLKKLIVGGFEKVYEIGKNFRNEGIDRTHNPEFTMMEYYQAYTDYKDQIQLFEKLVNTVVKKVKGSLQFEYQGKALNFKKWETLSLKKAVKKYSCLEHNKDQENLKEALELLSNNRKKFENKKTLSKKDIKCLDPDKTSFHGFFNFIKKLEPKGDYQKFEESLNALELSKETEEDLKGELTVLAFEILAERHLWNPTFITDFPLSVSPLTKQHRDSGSPITNKESKYRLVERFEPYIAGMELGNAYTELNDPIDQRNRLEQQKLTLKKDSSLESRSSEGGNLNPSPSKEKESPHPIDENFLHALELGMPPTGGVGLGIERLVMILSNQKSIRDCILFPALKDKS